jgi:O-acetyl-ADP-ribose deacetylase (regulator of RNase III)
MLEAHGMIQFIQGNLFDAPVEALVNPVNTVGAFGKGLALEFHHRIPENTHAYLNACETGTLGTGRVLVVDRGVGQSPRWIINVATKKHWRHPSRLEYVRSGLDALIASLQEHHISSVAVPALGCGLGGLRWQDVRPLIEVAFRPLEDVDVWVFEPFESHH